MSRRGWLAGALLLGAVSGGVGVSAAAPELGGYLLSASTSGVSFLYDQPTAGQVFSPLVGVDGVHALTTLGSGPAGYALSSIAWPGATPANAGPQLGAPTYPVRAEAFSPQGPADATYTDAPGTMKAHADALDTEALTASPAAPIPGVFEAGGVTSRSRSFVEDGLAVSEGLASISDVVLGGGVVGIKSVVTTVKATSDGTTGTVSGATVLTGVTIGGMPTELGGEAGPVANQLNEQVLKAAGISLYPAAPFDVVDGAAASRSLGGLVVRFSGAALQDVGVPPDVPTDQTVLISLGGATAAASASVADALGLPPDDLGLGDAGLGATDVGGGGSLSTDGGVSGDLTSPSTGAGTAGGSSGDTVVATGLASQVLDEDGIPFALVLAAMAVALVAAGRLRLVADRLLAARVVATPCPLQQEESSS